MSIDLSTNYLGLDLKNPLVPSASPLSKNLDTARRLEDAGAAALVMYSLFEEEVESDDEMFAALMDQSLGHGEADSYLPAAMEIDSRLDHYLAQLVDLKTALDIPVIASLNAVTEGGWLDHAVELAESGADALELNVYYVAADIQETAEQVEQRYMSILSELKEQINIPVAIKIGPQFSSPGHFVKRLEASGADGVVMFNRFYQPDIDLESLKVNPCLTLSRSSDALLAMRWIAILHGRVDLSLAATGGIHTSSDALKMLLAGADVVQMAASLLQQGPQHLAVVLSGIKSWLEENEYESVAQMRGSVSHKHAMDPVAFERANYISILEGYPAPDFPPKS